VAPPLPLRDTIYYPFGISTLRYFTIHSVLQLQIHHYQIHICNMLFTRLYTIWAHVHYPVFIH